MNIFVRFGGLDLKTQKGYKPNPETFHSPPSRRGIYCFPLKAIELFLIGGGYDKLSSDQKLRMRKEFTHSGNVWHHLGQHCKPHEIIGRHGSWVKTSVSGWKKAFTKESLANRYRTWEGSRTTSINEPVRSGVCGFTVKDHYEVFFDEKVGSRSLQLGSWELPDGYELLLAPLRGQGYKNSYQSGHQSGRT